MEQLHAHAVLDMMVGNSYTEESLKESIINKFGAERRFCTCSAENMNADDLIVFLKEMGKFKPSDNGFTVDITQKCSHDADHHHG